MPKPWSDNSSTITDVSGSLDISQSDSEREVNAMYNILAKEMEVFKNSEKKIKENDGRPLLAKNRTLVAVCSFRSSFRLSTKCNGFKQKRWFKLLRRKPAPSPVVVATDDTLQDALDDIKRGGECRELAIVVSGHLGSISFRIPRAIRVLMVIRCGFGSNIDRQLCVSGDSTFRDAELQEWQYKRHKGVLAFGPGVGISIDPEAPRWAHARQSLRRGFTAGERERLARHFDVMRNRPVDGEWWREWRGSVASIMGVLSGGVKLAAAVKASAGGAFFHLNYGILSLKAGGGFAQASFLASAAGPAVLVGAGVAAAVYFVPWDKLFAWFEGMLPWLLDRLRTIWSMIKDWLYGSGVPPRPTAGYWEEKPRHRMPRPM
ncbi:hypothetical protein LX36DRAFT_179457 [Colletotrichum falcatum]|nr:hypothetical protein LX36DRAFT_179457 [Colletotrichum falcatum]